jgi:glycosyltransferase involved in cell wall biosynthesis
MNSSNQVFAHQRRVVTELSKHFSSIEVLTAEKFSDSPIDNVSIISSGWETAGGVRNIFRFYRAAIPLVLRNRGVILFSHMTDVQSLLIGPLCKIFRIKHYLWYAHKSYSIYLRLLYPLLDGLITSTPGSCPIRGKKVTCIGQMADAKLPKGKNKLPQIPPNSFYHVGRIDPSKNIPLIIQTLAMFRLQNRPIELHLYGESSSTKTTSYYRMLKHTLSKSEFGEWVYFHGAVKHSDIANISQNHDAFIHAYRGSLDKSLIEAILLKRIVISANPEFLREFQLTEGCASDIVSELARQLESIFSSRPKNVLSSIDFFYQLALKEHSMTSWIPRLISILGRREEPSR